jgi:alkylation response protein AidB-like acyl-CoA dehydrogenase
VSGAVRRGRTPEQVEIARTIDEFVAERSTDSDVRRVMVTAAGFDESTWSALGEMGIPALAIAEDLGGLGLGRTEQSLVFEAAGAGLLCAPLLSGALATRLLQLGTERELAAELLAAVAGENRRVTVALGEPDGAVGYVPSVRAERSGGAWTVSGRCRFVLDGHTAHDLLVVAHTAEGPVVLAVEAGHPGVTRRVSPGLDLTRRQAEIELVAVPARLLLEGAAVPGAVRATLDHGLVLLAAEQVGGAARCLDVAVAYAKTRSQYGRIIGSFQAVKHTCANMLISLEAARATMIDAVAAEGDRQALAASLAKVVCSDAYFGIASDALHVHGGIGFTWEHSSHLYFRRAKSTQLMLGSPARHRERLLAEAGLARSERTEDAA